jgi:ATP-binding cassette subfamily F protein 3
LIKPGNTLLMDEPTNHLDLASSEALAHSLQSYDGTLIFVSHNRSFVRRLATRIWNVADGHVETYPGTLDEYMETCRQRQQQPSAAKIKPAPVARAERPAGGAAPAPAKPVAAPDPAARNAEQPAARSPNVAAAVSGNAKPSAVRPDSAPAGNGAPARASKNRIQKLEREVADLEKRIGELETVQKQRSDLLADPTVYADKQRSSQLLVEFRGDQPELEKLTARWEQAQGELETLSKS